MERHNIVHVSTLSKVIQRFDLMPIKILTASFRRRNTQVDSKIHMQV